MSMLIAGLRWFLIGFIGIFALDQIVARLYEKFHYGINPRGWFI